METRQGIAVSPGVAIGPAVVLGAEGFRIPQRLVAVDIVDSEIHRLQGALQSVIADLQTHEALASARLGRQYGAIFAAHRQLAQDPKLGGEIERLIREHCYSPEYAVSRVLRDHARTLQGLGDGYFAERAHDLLDLEKRILQHLLGERREELAHLSAPAIVLAHNLTPSETANLDKKFVLGFSTEVGGKSSHTAILAGALGLPAVVGVGSFLAGVSGGETVIIDGHDGLVIIDPDEATLARYRAADARQKTVAIQLQSLGPLPAVTQDGVEIQLFGNIEFPSEVEHCVACGAAGIGLYRTEFLYLEGGQEPTEQQHYEAYTRVLRAFPGKPVVIRTLDLGAEKFPQTMQQIIEATPNPTLGLRSLRLTLANLPMFKTQLRAVLRAAALGDVRLMFPLVSTLYELRQARWLVAEVAEDLAEEGLEHNPKPRIGMMVEVPSAAILAEEFAREVDFFSIGTNDLIQYTLGVDRANPAVSHLYSSADPAVCRLIRQVVAAASRRDVTVSVCGQMSSDPMFTAFLVGTGLRELSVSPNAILEVKQVIRNMTLAQAREIAERSLEFDVARDLESYFRGELHRFCPQSEI